jgi:hypothetical protein
MLSFLLVILFGNILSFVSIYTMLGDLDTSKCKAQLWTFNLGFTLSILPLIVKVNEDWCLVSFLEAHKGIRTMRFIECSTFHRDCAE